MSSAVSKRKLFDKWVEHRLSIPQHEMIERSTHTVRNARSIVVVRQNDDIPCRKSPLKGKGLGADSDNWGNVDFFFRIKMPRVSRWNVGRWPKSGLVPRMGHPGRDCHIAP